MGVKAGQEFKKNDLFFESKFECLYFNLEASQKWDKRLSIRSTLDMIDL